MPIKILFSILSRANYSRIKSVIKVANNNPNLIPLVVVGCGAICEEYGNILEEHIQKQLFQLQMKIMRIERNLVL